MNARAPVDPAGDAAKARARDRLATVASMAAILSHPVRNRLASLRAVLELLEAGLEKNLSPEHRELALREFNVFIEDFNLGIEMVRCDFGRMEAVSGRTVRDEAVRLFRPAAERAGIVLGTGEEGGAALVGADRALLRQSILNLLRNAADALAGRAEPRVTLRSGGAGGRWWLEVADNGPGVPARIHHRLFREPVAARPAGAGLGLLLCRDAMTLMDGAIEYLNAPGAPGARFRLEVPLREARAVPAPVK